MTSPHSIAVAQTWPRKGDLAANLEEHIRLIKAAAKEGADIVLFPELSLTGYELELAETLAFSEGDERLAPLVHSASNYSVIPIVGAPVRIVHQLYLGAFIIFPDGAIRLYTKHRLGAFPHTAHPDGIVPPPEDTIFRPGDRNPLIRFGDQTAAVAICRDIARPSHAQRAADLGASTYLASMFVIPSDLQGDTAKLREYAVQHSLIVAMANFGGPSGGLPAAGHSSIWSAGGEVLVELDSQGAGVGIVTDPRGSAHEKVVMLN